MKPFFILIGVFLVLRLARPVLVLNQLLRSRSWKNRLRLASDDEVPTWMRDGLREPVAELEALGFQPAGWVAFERAQDPANQPRYFARLLHPQAGAQAVVGFSTVPDSVLPWSIQIMTYGVDERVVRTMRGGERSSIGEPPGSILVEPHALTTVQQWDAHGAAVRAAAITPAAIDFDAAIARWSARQAELFDARVREGALLPAGGGRYILSFRAALAATRQVLRATTKLNAQRAERLKMRRATLTPLPVIPLEEDVAAYARFLDVTTGPPRASFLVALFAASVLLFLVTGAYSMGAAATAAIVLGIVLFHELGHYLAMRALGYVDTTIFFVPFLGGVAAGRKDDATVAQRMIVLLAGPVPSLVIALAAVLLTHRAGPRDLWMLVAAINFFNLLPILPLDGGQMAHMLLFARRPWLDVTSRAMAGVGLVLIGLAVSGVFLGVLGVLALVQLPKSRQQAVLRRQFAEARAHFPDVPATTLFFRVLRASPLATAPFAQKVVLARTTLAYADAHGPLGWGRILGWLTAYGGALGLGIAAVVTTFTVPAQAKRASRGEVTIVVPVPCASSETPAPAAKGPRYPRLSGVASFHDVDAARAAAPRLAATVPGVATRALGPVLLVWRDLRGAKDDDDRLATAVQQSGGDFEEHMAYVEPLELQCDAPDATVAAAIEERLGEYFTFGLAGLSIPAPWTLPDPTDAQALARRTLRVATEAARTYPPGVEKIDLSFSDLWSGLTGDGEAALQRAREEQAKRRAAAESALAGARAAGPIDEDVARLYGAWSNRMDDGAYEDAQEELRKRVGAGPEARGMAVTLAARVSHADARVSVTVGAILPQQFDGDVLPALSWLCARGCANPRLRVKGR